jgi:hypothetical protein
MSTSQKNPLTREQIDRAAKALEFEAMEQRLSKWLVDPTKELPEVHPLISIDGNCVCSRGNISAICGEAKSKKTFLTSALVASAMAMPITSLNNFKNVNKNMDMRVLWVDTEQSEMHVHRVVDRIMTMTGAKLSGSKREPRLETLKLREASPSERCAILMDAIEHYGTFLPFDLIVIDGIADLQRNTNDLEESDALVNALMRLSTETNTHIICVLHTNPGSDKARGHLGSSLQRKAESVLYVHRNGDYSVVEPQFCRNEPFERFAFTISEDGIPELCEVPNSEGLGINDRIVALLNETYGGCVERVTLSNKTQESMGMTRHTALMRIRRLVTRGVLYDNDGLISSSANITPKVATPTVAPAVAPAVAPVVAPQPTYTAPPKSIYEDDDPPF